MILPRPTFSCPDCAQKCTSASGLTRHRNAVHRELTPTLDDEGNDTGENFTYRRHPYLTGKVAFWFFFFSSFSEIMIQQSHATRMEYFSLITLHRHHLCH